MSSSQPEREPGSADEATLIDRLCDQFEAACKARQTPRIEDYLGHVAESARPALLRELMRIFAAILRKSE
jgi:hypothetical protein